MDAGWTMGWANAGKTACLGFDHGAKVVATEDALLLQMGADGLHIVVRQFWMARDDAQADDATFRIRLLRCAIFRVSLILPRQPWQSLAPLPISPSPVDHYHNANTSTHANTRR
jgi:hypothetical protein